MAWAGCLPAEASVLPFRVKPTKGDLLMLPEIVFLMKRVPELMALECELLGSFNPSDQQRLLR